jgi:hypothetical protein
MERNPAEQGVKRETAFGATAACLWFYNESWYAREDSNL